MLPKRSFAAGHCTIHPLLLGHFAGDNIGQFLAQSTGLPSQCRPLIEQANKLQVQTLQLFVQLSGSGCLRRRGGGASSRCLLLGHKYPPRSECSNRIPIGGCRSGRPDARCRTSGDCDSQQSSCVCQAPRQITLPRDRQRPSTAAHRSCQATSGKPPVDRHTATCLPPVKMADRGGSSC